MLYWRKIVLEKKKKIKCIIWSVIFFRFKVVKNKMGYLLVKIIYCKLEMFYNYYWLIEKKYMSGEKNIIFYEK